MNIVLLTTTIKQLIAIIKNRIIPISVIFYINQPQVYPNKSLKLFKSLLVFKYPYIIISAVNIKAPTINKNKNKPITIPTFLKTSNIAKTPTPRAAITSHKIDKINP